MVYLGSNTKDSGWSTCNCEFLGIVTVGGLSDLGFVDLTVRGPNALEPLVTAVHFWALSLWVVAGPYH